MPSRIVTSAWPWDSPAVRNRSIGRSFYPKYLRTPDARARRVPEANPRGRVLAPLHVARSQQEALPWRLPSSSPIDFSSPAIDRIIDLASGEDVVLVTSTAGGPTDERRWVMRCDWFFSVRHRAIAELVDYGVVGETRRFEAWRCGPPWRGSRQEGDRIGELARSFLRANGVSVGDSSNVDVRSCGARAVVLPGPAAGYAESSNRTRPRWQPSGRPAIEQLAGCRIVQRRAIAAVAELFEVSTCRPRILALGGATGAGVDTALIALSRAARLNGFVPVSTSIGADSPGSVEEPLALRPRRRRRIGSEAWQRFLELTVQSPRGHVQLFVGPEPIAHVHLVWLDRLTPRALADAVRPANLGASLRRRVESAARRARGLPGRFASLLWGADPGHRGASTARVPPSSPPSKRRSYGDETMPVAGPTALVDTIVLAGRRESWPR